ncbi:uncharacterized protein LOC115023402 isoform X2 [Cottoperca gobio]|uniref:Uncharacterized protein LOC115023402 isoform X2 n=1 Tax=Cottoperca gobio TaxID=56716 RepID=A0A6J2RJS6_COTGO|nr:uncharacterized protein LOC115023402 isoform X2 [Cottoperca gobio]
MYRCERMKLLLCSLLLASLHTRSSWSVSSGTLDVTQTPDVSVMEGETVNISCCWPTHFERVRVTWQKNQTLKTELFTSQRSQQKEISNCSHLTFTNVTRGDSGRYICCVTMEIPFLNTGKGDGTFITVRDNTTDHTTEGEHPESSSSHLQFTVIIPLAVVALLLLITLVGFCCLRRRHAQAARVIYEVPHIDSEEVEMDKHSTSSSRGSSQWCQVPVYESFDYFERVENKESG